MNIKRNIIFALESRKKNGVPVIENVPIRMRVVYAGNRVEFTTGYRIDASKWDIDKQRVKNGCTNKLKQSASEINSDLLKYYTIIQDIFKSFEVEEAIPTPNQLKDVFNSKTKATEPEEKLETKEVLMMDFFDEFIIECGKQNNWSKATHEKFSATKKHLISFNPELTFEALDDATLMNYVNFLQDEKDLRNSTIAKQINLLKWFLRWTVKKGYNKNMAFDFFKPRLKEIQKKVIFLTWEEIKQVGEFKIPDTKQYLERVRDVFLFCCFTGLRHSDVYNLKRSDVKNNHIEVTTIKTADSLVIEFNKHSKSILEKYKDIQFENDKVLPVISNQKMNDYIKELAEMVGLNEQIRETYYKGNERIDEVSPKYVLLGTHTGRRSFICNALALGIAPHVVMKWTGHTDYKSMKPYIDVADTIKANAMEMFNKL